MNARQIHAKIEQKQFSQLNANPNGGGFGRGASAKHRCEVAGDLHAPGEETTLTQICSFHFYGNELAIQYVVWWFSPIVTAF